MYPILISFPAINRVLPSVHVAPTMLEIVALLENKLLIVPSAVFMLVAKRLDAVTPDGAFNDAVLKLLAAKLVIVELAAPRLPVTTRLPVVMLLDTRAVIVPEFEKKLPVLVFAELIVPNTSNVPDVMLVPIRLTTVHRFAFTVLDTSAPIVLELVTFKSATVLDVPTRFVADMFVATRLVTVAL